MGLSGSRPRRDPAEDGSIEYGRVAPSGTQRVPVSLRTATLEPALLEYLQREMALCGATQDQLPDLGFYAARDYPRLPRHTYFEGYFHATPPNAAAGGPADPQPPGGPPTEDPQGGPFPFRSLNPRYFFEMHKPAAPRALRAFFEAVRRRLTPRLLAALDACADAPLAKPLRRLVEGGRHFADLAIQVHAGQGVRGGHLGWHTDTVNSTLHLALSLRGERALHSHRAPTDDPGPEAVQTVVEWQAPGDVYVSSPAFFAHAVEYPRTAWRDRIIAVQARFLFDMREFEELHSVGRDSDVEVMGHLSGALAAAPVDLPSLAELQTVEAELAMAEAPFEAAAAAALAAARAEAAKAGS